MAEKTLRLEEADGVRFLVLELVEGETLAERVANGALPVEETLEICRQIAEGVEAVLQSPNFRIGDLSKHQLA